MEGNTEMRLTSVHLHRFKGFEQAEFDIRPRQSLLGLHIAGLSLAE
jgi:hypothetical protein